MSSNQLFGHSVVLVFRQFQFYLFHADRVEVSPRNLDTVVLFPLVLEVGLLIQHERVNLQVFTCLDHFMKFHSFITIAIFKRSMFFLLNFLFPRKIF